MRKYNPSGPSKRRRSSESGSYKGGKPAPGDSKDTPRKAKGSDSERPFRRAFKQDSGSSSARPDASKFDRRRSGPPDSRDNTNKNFEKGGRDRKRPFSKGNDEGKPFRERKENFSADSKRVNPTADFRRGGKPQTKRTASFPGNSKDEKPFKKFDKPSSGKRRSYGEGSQNTKGSFGTDRPDRGSDKRSGSKPFFKNRDESPDSSTPKKQSPGRISVGGFTKSTTPKGSDLGDSRGKGAARTGDKNYSSNTPKDKNQQREKQPGQEGKIRLNKFIANSGVCSRREADELIKLGVISVNGKTITELGYKVNPGDEIRHEEKVLRAEKPVYVLLNKPKGFLTTTADPQERRTVMQLVGNFVKERVYPVGRLDRNTTGLLVLTNDGELAERLMHPSYKVKKIYKVELDRPLAKADAQRIVDGVKLEEGRAIVDDLAFLSDDKKTIGLEIHIGWNRVVRRIFETLEYEVLKLDRTAYAGLTKKDLGRGEWRFLKKEEIVLLKHF